MRFWSKSYSAVLWSLGLVLLLQVAAPGRLSAETLAWLWDDNATKLGKKVAGEWQQGSREFIFQSGVMSFLRTGVVFASYQLLDGETIRFQRVTPDSNWDWIVKVKFPASNKMVWYSVQSGTLKEWWSFERMVPVDENARSRNIKILQEEVAKTNKTLPRMIDQYKRVDYMRLDGLVIKSHVTMLEDTTGRTNEEFNAAVKNWKSFAAKKLCGERLEALKYGVRFSYELHDLSGNPIYPLFYTISIEDCANRY